MNELIQSAKELEQDLIRDRRHLHQNPELSFVEHETAAYIRERLTAMDIPFRTLADTGTVAHIGSGDRCVALRADIDALPIHEESGVEFASRNDGVMHACGHDAHTAMLLAAARMLKDRENTLGGVVKLIFQPGEEKLPGGASIMIKEGALLDPVPEVIFGQHVYPDAPAGQLGFVPGAMMAAADELYWTIHGRGGHAAQPHQTVDPIVIAANLINQLQSIISRTLNPFDSGVLSVTSIHAGHANNVIPDTVEMLGTLRSLNLEWRESAINKIEQFSQTLAETAGGSCDVRVVRGYPPLFNNDEATAFARGTALNLVDSNHVFDFEPKMWGEDFAYYAQAIPACFWMLGVRAHDRDSAPGLHNSHFVIEESALHRGAAMMSAAAIQRLRS